MIVILCLSICCDTVLINLIVVVVLRYVFLFIFFFFKQKTAYEMRISDWSSDVCSSDLFPQTLNPWRRDDGRRDQATADRGPRASRFISVTTAWRTKLFRERAVQSKREGGAIHFLTADAAHDVAIAGVSKRTEERLVGKEGVGTGSYRWAADQ